MGRDGLLGGEAAGLCSSKTAIGRKSLKTIICDAEKYRSGGADRVDYEGGMTLLERI